MNLSIGLPNEQLSLMSCFYLLQVMKSAGTHAGAQQNRSPAWLACFADSDMLGLLFEYSKETRLAKLALTCLTVNARVQSGLLRRGTACTTVASTPT